MWISGFSSAGQKKTQHTPYCSSNHLLSLELQILQALMSFDIFSSCKTVQDCNHYLDSQTSHWTPINYNNNHRDHRFASPQLSELWRAAAIFPDDSLSLEAIPYIKCKIHGAIMVLRMQGQSLFFSSRLWLLLKKASHWDDDASWTQQPTTFSLQFLEHQSLVRRQRFLNEQRVYAVAGTFCTQGVVLFYQACWWGCQMWLICLQVIFLGILTGSECLGLRHRDRGRGSGRQVKQTSRLVLPLGRIEDPSDELPPNNSTYTFNLAAFQDGRRFLVRIYSEIEPKYVEPISNGERQRPHVNSCHFIAKNGTNFTVPTILVNTQWAYGDAERIRTVNKVRNCQFSQELSEMHQDYLRSVVRKHSS